ncbi:MAG: CBS domain-containing protein [Pseudobdellovibrionaceae bacterium]
MALKDHMTRELITIGRTSTLAEAHRVMTNHWIRHLPVVDDAEEYIIGMLSERDLFSASTTPNIPVEKIMSKPLRTFSVDTSVKTVVEAMIDEKISAFLITKEDEIVGIVTSDDLLVLLDQMLKMEEPQKWDLSDLLANPTLQRTAYIIGQSGI